MDGLFDRATRRSGTTLAALVLLASTAAAAGPGGQGLAGGDAALARGDLASARVEFASHLSAHPDDYSALWRLARVESELGEDARGDAQRNLVIAAVEHARAAVKVAPDSAQGHVWLAVTLGRQALKEGPKTRLALSREIKSEVDRALAIDPGIGRAYHVRALWNRKIASLSFIEKAAANTVLGGVPRGASMENAVRDLQKAIELEPGYVNHHLELGRTYMELKRWPEARRELDTANTLPPTSSPRDVRYQNEARNLLGRIERR
jgi:Tfp pilus assembly protein PilF